MVIYGSYMFKYIVSKDMKQNKKKTIPSKVGMHLCSKHVGF